MHGLLAGRLRLVDRIGAGGTSTVWRAWDLRDRAYVAAKLMPLEHPDELPRLVHPHLLTPNESLRDGAAVAHLMPLVRGGTTDRLLGEHGALPAAYVMVLLDQLLDALAALHALGFAHRDVKPSNLLLEASGTRRPHLRLADLDAATRLGESPRTFAGTDGYLAPEARPASPATPGHDLYAAGVTTAELLTGRLPRCERDLPRGPFGRLLRDLIDAVVDRRPATAEEGRARLHAIGVPLGAPWASAPFPPHVPDRMRRLTLVERWRLQGRSAAQ